MFWPLSSDSPCSCAQCLMWAAISVLPEPGPPLTYTTALLTEPPSRNCPVRASSSVILAGHLSQPSRAGLGCFPFSLARVLPANSYTGTGSSFPLTVIFPSDLSSRMPPQAPWVAWSTRTQFCPAWPMSLADRFTTSPSTVYSRRVSLPTTPHQHIPVAMPARPTRFSSRNVSQKRVAASTALRGSSVKWFSGGSPKHASSTMPLSSTRNLLTLPSSA
mmetsp:Transcript_115093/g.326487  ORF Transcript_115093/g.326487 Transcript_115093/m.326487 type:complete len:218 (-) Transcript_115093:228-881(-)